ncbi:MAG TPA: xanthine dehydrogenase family protein, partial [Thermoplasmata archaeon]|nr:xanthine dehydrogenase family protein [Thermoplasmata archaeon]
MPRSDAAEKLRGAVRYGTDLEVPGMLWGALVPSPVACGRIRSIETSAARRMPGVAAAISAADLANLLPTGGSTDRPAFPSQEVSYRGEPVAAVAARTLAEARAAAARVIVDVEARPPLIDLETRFPEWPGSDASGAPEVIAHVRARGGPVERAFADAELVHSETYRTSGIAHVALEPHACLATVAGDRWHVVTSTQTPFGVREDAGEILGIGEADLVVEGSWVGGGFGGKGASFLEPFALLLARASGRPVRLALTYREEFLLDRSTQPAVIRLDTAVHGGRMTARRVRLLLDSGSSMPGRDFATGYSIGFLLGPYRIPAFEMEGYAVRTNKPPFGPHRAPFAPQCVFAVESHTDSLARRLGVDPIDFRLAHVWNEGDRTALGQRVGPFGGAAALSAARETVRRWRAEGPSPGRGIGLGLGFWSTSTSAGGEARVRLTARELVIEQGEHEIGSGSVVRGLVAVAERATGLPTEAIRIEVHDTATDPYDAGVYGSRTVGALGQAVEKAARRLLEIVAERLGESPVRLERRGEAIWAVGPSRHRPVAELLRNDEDGGWRTLGKHYGSSTPIDESKVEAGAFFAYTDFTASVHASEVAVDAETGSVRVVRARAFTDVGVALDPGMVQGQVEGGVVMGLGQALTEELVWGSDGRLTNPSLLDYRVPTLAEIPPIGSEAIEGFLGAGPFGAKGVGEPPI